MKRRSCASLPLIPGAVVGWKCLASRCLSKTGLHIYDECIRHSEHHEKSSKSSKSLGSLGSSLPKRKSASWQLPWHCDFRARIPDLEVCVMSRVKSQHCFWPHVRATHQVPWVMKLVSRKWDCSCSCCEQLKQLALLDLVSSNEGFNLGKCKRWTLKISCSSPWQVGPCCTLANGKYQTRSKSPDRLQSRVCLRLLRFDALFAAQFEAS